MFCGKLCFSLVIFFCIRLEILMVFELGCWKIGIVIVGLLFSSECRVYWLEFSLIWVMLCRWVILLLVLVWMMMFLNFFLVIR